ncbi:hypothetical protein AHAS_Ahas13G0342900 [Arachis hypogaea]
MIEYQQSGDAPGPLSEQDMRYFPPPQYDLCHDPNGQNQRAFNSPYSTYQEPSSLEQNFNSFMQNFPTSLPSFSIENSSSLEYTSTQNSFQNPHDSIHQPQHSFHNSQNSFHTPQHNFTTTHTCHQSYFQLSSLELAVEDYLQWSKESLES